MPDEHSWLLGMSTSANGGGDRSSLLASHQTGGEQQETISSTGPGSSQGHTSQDILSTPAIMQASSPNRQDVQEAKGLSGSDEKLPPVTVDDDALEYMVSIPEFQSDGCSSSNKFRFSWRKLWAFTGPGFLMSIAYLDPGNIESDLQSGAVAGYRLLWVLFSAHILGFFLQRLSARLGATSGRNLAEMAYEFYPRVPRLFVWIMIEIAIIGSDMQEVIGTAIAFALLSNKAIPLFIGVLITMADTFTFLMVDRYGFRKLEVLFAVLISAMAISFGYEFFLVGPQVGSVLEGMFVPVCPGCGRSEFLQAVGIIGAVIMPHNLYLHSALVKSRRINRSRKQAVSEANYYYFIESAVALICSFFINMFVVSVFAHGLHGKTNRDVFNECEKRPSIFDRHMFPNNTDPVEADIYKGGIFLGCEFGLFALYVWGIGIMAAGQSSTMTGTYAGQYVMEGFLKIRWPRWRRVMFTRAIAIGPTLFVALMARGVENLTKMNDILNCIQMIQLPFALLPVLTFASHPRVMYEFRAARKTQFFSLLVSVLVIVIDLYFSLEIVREELVMKNWYSWAILISSATIYMVAVVYLFFMCLNVMGVVPRTLLERSIPSWLLPLDTAFKAEAPWEGLVKQVTMSESSGSTAMTSVNAANTSPPKGSENIGYTHSATDLTGSS